MAVLEAICSRVVAAVAVSRYRMRGRSNTERRLADGGPVRRVQMLTRGLEAWCTSHNNREWACRPCICSFFSFNDTHGPFVVLQAHLRWFVVNKHVRTVPSHVFRAIVITTDAFTAEYKRVRLYPLLCRACFMCLAILPLLYVACMHLTGYPTCLPWTLHRPRRLTLHNHCTYLDIWSSAF